MRVIAVIVALAVVGYSPSLQASPTIDSDAFCADMPALIEDSDAQMAICLKLEKEIEPDAKAKWSKLPRVSQDKCAHLIDTLKLPGWMALHHCAVSELEAIEQTTRDFKRRVDQHDQK